MKFKAIAIIATIGLFFACGEKKQKESPELKQEIIKNDSISNKIDKKVEKINSKEENLDNLLNDL